MNRLTGCLSLTGSMTGCLASDGSMCGTLGVPSSIGNYNLLDGKPSINAVTVEGDKLGADYNLQDKMQELSQTDIEKILYLG